MHLFQAGKILQISFPEHKFPFFSGYRDNFRIRDFIKPSEWINKHFRLSTSYAVSGNINLFPWQIVPVDSVLYFDFVMLVAPTQTGKSMLAEGVMAYRIDNVPTNMMLIYAKKETVQDVFEDRLKPLVREVPAIRKYWSGHDEDLTQRKIRLKNLIARIASAGLKSDIASWNAGFVYGSEVAKWPKKDFSQTKAVEGRKQASKMLGRKTLTLYETSPDNDQDLSYNEVHKPGTVIFFPHYECPHCQHWQALKDSQVKEKPNRANKKDHDPERIRRDKAAWYECENCLKEITEEDRFKSSFNVRWLSVDKKSDYEVLKLDKNRPQRAVFRWNRFVVTTWTFAECLACFYEALRSPNPMDFKTYRNEDMADWVKIAAKRFESSYLLSKRQKYFQYGLEAYIPDGVSVLLLGCDSQDNGFYFVIRGYGKGMESWLVRSDFIKCDMKDDKYSNPAEVYNTFYGEIHRFPFRKKNGKELQIYSGIIDRGGHRSKDVDYICNHIYYMSAYIGSTDKRCPLITTTKGGYYQGNTENLSRIVDKQIESNIWHLPTDITKEYCEQVLNEFDEEIIDTKGRTKKRRVEQDPNHYRSCENYICGLLNALNLQSQLFDDKNVDYLEKNLEVKTEEKKSVETKKIDNTHEDNILGDFDNQLRSWGW